MENSAPDFHDLGPPTRETRSEKRTIVSKFRAQLGETKFDDSTLYKIGNLFEVIDSTVDFTTLRSFDCNLRSI